MYCKHSRFICISSFYIFKGLQILWKPESRAILISHNTATAILLFPFLVLCLVKLACLSKASLKVPQKYLNYKTSPANHTIIGIQTETSPLWMLHQYMKTRTKHDTDTWNVLIDHMILYFTQGAAFDDPISV